MIQVAVRPATQAEFAEAIKWAAAEGWNPGIDDLKAFYPADPPGFLMGWLEGEPVSSIAVVRYGTAFGFLGFYIVHPDLRGSGIGLTTWNAGLAHLDGRAVGLDGVIAQQDNYRKSGFVLAGRYIRFTGKPNLIGELCSCINIRPVGQGDLKWIVAHDARHFPCERRRFICEWAFPASASTRRKSVYAIRHGDVAGFGTIRECYAGYKIGPLFANSETIAEALFAALCGAVPVGSEISLDAPEDNKAAIHRAEATGLVPVFETARMYKGRAPDLPTERIFGVTTFELG